MIGCVAGGMDEVVVLAGCVACEAVGGVVEMVFG